MPSLFLRFKFLTAGLVLAACGLGLVGCGKAKGPARPDPHTAEGVMVELQAQGLLLNDALLRKDYGYLHDYGYYFSGLAQSLFAKLDEEQKQRLRGSFEELVRLSSELDRAAGGRHAAATEATVQRIQTVLKDMDTQFRGMKKGG